MLKIKELGESPYPSRIRSAIGYRNRTQKDVAAAIGLSLNSLSRITRGETLDPSADIIRGLASELDVSCAYLMGESDEIERKQ